jgi:sec-independent protein translocase protein TatA
MDIGVPELLIILLIVIVIFGAGRVAKLGGELGQGIREFRKGLSGDDEAKNPTPSTPPTQNEERQDVNEPK